ncbi:MAG TPA: universal stress protein [Acidimicrobiales bacterium]|nr:universal stress protein [Acidimicrobiales bacterium]
MALASELPSNVSTLIVPLDGSKFSERALPVAAALAGRLDADISLLSAVAREDDVAERARALAVIDIPGHHVDVSVVVDLDPAGALHEALRRRPGAVACMATHGRGRSAALVGSLATEVVARGHDPLVVVGPMVEKPATGAGVVACVDETLESEAAIRVAQHWAGLLLSEPMTVIVVAEPVPPPVRGPARRRFGPDGDVEAHLASLVAPFRAEGAKIRTEVVYDPISPADGIRTYLDDHPAMLVVLRSRARTGLARLAFGSVAAGVVHGSGSAAVIVPWVDEP